LYEIIPHKQAPLIQNTEQFKILLEEIIYLLEHNPDLLNNKDAALRDPLIQVMRQAGFVSLFFFLKYIASATGPYDRLNEDLHLEMCNFRQKAVAPGSRCAAFLPRGHYKSTIFTTGGCAWELLRDPNLTIGLFNAKYEKALDFMHTVQRTFDSNPLFAMLYPEYVPRSNVKRWNDTEMVLPNRLKHKTEPNLRCGSVGGASEGFHYDIIVLDDIIGFKQLNANRQSNAEMYKTSNWFQSIGVTLLQKWSESRIILVGTRYAIDDVYEFVMKDAKEITGCREKMKYETKEDNKWCIYYRKVIENDEIILPEVTNKEELTKLMEKDPWTAMTQYFNNPTEAGMTELNLYTIHECRLDFTEEKGWMIDYMEGEDNRVISLSDCYVVQACDPAASEKGFHAKTSRSAVGVLAHAADDKRFLIALNVDFVAASRMFDWMFSNAIKFDGYLQKTVLEAQGAFKILNGILRNEENRRRTEAYENGQKFAHLNLQSVNKAGEKDAVIRSSLDL
jgi:hypothetical protein